MARKNARKKQQGEAILVVNIRADTLPELKRLAGEAADRERIPLSEWVARLIAREFNRPDLVPHRRRGRPRKELPPSVPA